MSMSHPAAPVRAALPEADGRTAAILYSPDGYQVSGARLMGRHAAGAGFLRAFVATERSAQLRGVVQRPAHAAGFAEEVRSYGFAGQIRATAFTEHAQIAQSGVLYLPGPGLAEFAWRRQGVSDGAYSLCGVTHTTASHRAMESLAQLPVAPLAEWDALICTSQAVLDSVQALLATQFDYLRWKLGASRLSLPQLPVIPLGVHCDDFAYDAAQRAQGRAQLGAGENDVVVVFLGRLSFHAKAHPQAMYLALEAVAAQYPGRGLHLVQCGWFANASIEQAFREAAEKLCPGVKHHFLDGRTQEARTAAWAGADIYVSLSDNIQETFGLSPVEAMAASLPVVVSDWDGYRDTVRDGVDGFRIPTMMPAAPAGQDLAERYDIGIDSYDMYCGHTCELVAVDVAATTRALARLVGDPDLRRRMGQAGRARARSLFDWTTVLGRYRELWAELNGRRAAACAAGTISPGPMPRAERLDPFRMFAAYASRPLGDADRLVALHDDPEQAWACLLQRRSLAVNAFARHVYPRDEECRQVLAQVVAHPGTTVGELLALFPAARRMAVGRGLVWMVKMHVLQFPGEG